MLKFACIGEKKEMFISHFLIDKNFEQMNIKHLLKSTANKMLVIDNKTSINKINEIISLIKNNKNSITILLLPKIRKKINLKDHIVSVFYPIHINDFENILNKNTNDPKTHFNDIFLDKRGLLVNKKNNLKTYLTEAEQDILRFLIFKQGASKKDLKKEILNLSPLVDSRSLESHLSRIRKKIKKINSATQIISVGYDNIQII